jgi:8-oxo-dGTP pyrophosphatase MutT (NUDIX family)
MKYVSAGGIIVRHAQSGLEMLLLNQVRSNGEQQWVMPKGGVESGESLLDAAQREVSEESGLTDLRILAPVGEQEFEFKGNDGQVHSKSVTWFLFESPPHADVSERNAEGFHGHVWLQPEEAYRTLTHGGFVDFLKQCNINQLLTAALQKRR